VQIICIWFSFCHCYLLVPAYQGCPGKEAVKKVSVSVYCSVDCGERFIVLVFSGSANGNEDVGKNRVGTKSGYWNGREWE